MNKPTTILAVLAHPDDESFGMGGTLALYASRGADVYLACATRGEAGTVDDEHLKGFTTIAELRKAIGDGDDGEPTLLLVRRGEGSLFIVIETEE